MTFLPLCLMKRGHVFFKFFCLCWLTSCNSDPHQGPYASVSVLCKASDDTSAYGVYPDKESQRFCHDIVDPALIGNVVKKFPDISLYASKIKNLLATQIFEKTNLIELRFYSDKKDFSPAFLDSLIHAYQYLRNDLLRHEKDVEKAQIDQRLKTIGDSLSLYNDTLKKLNEKYKVREQTSSNQENKRLILSLYVAMYEKIRQQTSQNNFAEALQLCSGLEKDAFLEKALYESARMKTQGKDTEKITNEIVTYLTNMIRASKAKMDQYAQEEATLLAKNPGSVETSWLRIKKTIALLEKQYVSLLEKRTSLVIGAAGRFYFLRIVDQPAYHSER